MLAGFVLARAAAGLPDRTISLDVTHLEQIRAWFWRPLREMQPADAGAYFGKVSGLWSGHPNAVKLADLDVICAVLGCDSGELLIPEPVPAARPANPYLIINNQTAMSTRPVSENWLTTAFHGLDATLERLRSDRQRDEALTCGSDPLHLAAVFGVDDTTAIRYATAAGQLLDAAAERAAAPS